MSGSDGPPIRRMPVPPEMNSFQRKVCSDQDSRPGRVRRTAQSSPFLRQCAEFAVPRRPSGEFWQSALFQEAARRHQYIGPAPHMQAVAEVDKISVSYHRESGIVRRGEASIHLRVRGAAFGIGSWPILSPRPPEIVVVPSGTLRLKAYLWNQWGQVLSCRLVRSRLRRD